METEDNDSFEDSRDNLSWFAYGYLCGEDDARRPPDPQGDAFGCLTVVVLIVCGVLWALTGSIAFAVICGLIGMVVAWKLCYGGGTKQQEDEYSIRKVKRGKIKVLGIDRKRRRVCSKKQRKD